MAIQSQPPIIDKPPTCPYCQQRVTAGDDSQRVSRLVIAHTACAWDVDTRFWTRRDEEAEAAANNESYRLSA